MMCNMHDGDVADVGVLARRCKHTCWTDACMCERWMHAFWHGDGAPAGAIVGWARKGNLTFVIRVGPTHCLGLAFGMGLKLQCSCNILTSWLKNKHDAGALIFSTQDSWIDLNDSLLKSAASTGFDQVQVLMDKLLEQNNRDSLRNTMIRQEEMFNGQVHELHRLYRAQRMLMAELKIKEPQIHSPAAATAPAAVTDTKNKYWSSTSTSETSHSSQISNLHHAAAQVKPGYNSVHQHGMLAGDEATIADEECDVELSLRIGCSERGSLQRPPWLFQAASLNRR